MGPRRLTASTSGPLARAGRLGLGLEVVFFAVCPSVWLWLRALLENERSGADGGAAELCLNPAASPRSRRILLPQAPSEATPRRPRLGVTARAATEEPGGRPDPRCRPGTPPSSSLLLIIVLIIIVLLIVLLSRRRPRCGPAPAPSSAAARQRGGGGRIGRRSRQSGGSLLLPSPPPFAPSAILAAGTAAGPVLRRAAPGRGGGVR